MKLLCWMHRKLRQTSISPVKNPTTGSSFTCLLRQPSDDEQIKCTEPSYDSPHKSQQSSSKVKASRKEEISGNESFTMIPDVFHGFLAIGTLGSEPTFAEPMTPSFPMFLDEASEEESESTTHLKFINNELENFLEAEAKEVGNELSQRSSHVSPVTLSSKKNEGEDAKACRNIDCPLQKYLFGSLVELPETRIQEKKEKTSLEGLFKRNNVTCEHSTWKNGKEEKQTKEKSSKNFMKMMLKKLHNSSKNSADAAGGDALNSLSTKRKLPKAFRMFSRKIHPVHSMAEKEYTESQRSETKNISHSGRHNDGNRMFQDKENKKSPLLMRDFSTLNQSHKGLNHSKSTANWGRWIKTDADYLVLELERKEEPNFPLSSGKPL